MIRYINLVNFYLFYLFFDRFFSYRYFDWILFCACLMSRSLMTKEKACTGPVMVIDVIYLLDFYFISLFF